MKHILLYINTRNKIKKMISYTFLLCILTMITSITYATSLSSESLTEESQSTLQDLSIDEYGNNHLNAFPITEKTKITGRIQDKFDYDVFSFSSKQDTDIVFKITQRYSAQFTILDYNGNPINSEHSIDYDDGYEYVMFHASRNIKYYLHIKCTLEAADYSFNYECLIDDYSNTDYDAVCLPVNEVIYGNFIDNSDIDLFNFNVSESGMYQMDYSQKNVK